MMDANEYDDFNSLFGIPYPPDWDNPDLQFQLPFRDSIDTASNDPYNMRISTPFSGFEVPSRCRQVRCKDFNSLFGIPGRGTGKDCGTRGRFQLPFRDSRGLGAAQTGDFPNISTPFSGFCWEGRWMRLQVRISTPFSGFY